MSPRRTARSVSLPYELHDIEYALAAVGRLAATAQEAPDLHDARREVWALEAVATLARERVRLLRQALNGDADPALLHHPGNAGPSGADGDVELTAWADGNVAKPRRRTR